MPYHNVKSKETFLIVFLFRNNTRKILQKKNCGVEKKNVLSNSDFQTEYMKWR